MKKYFIFMFAVLFAACSTISGGGDDYTPPTPPDATGIWLAEDYVHSTELLPGEKFAVYSDGEYTLELTIETGEEMLGVTYTWAINDGTYVDIYQDESNSKKARIEVTGPTDSATEGNFTVTVTGSDESEVQMNFVAKFSDAPVRRTLNGRTVSLKVIDNFDDDMISTNETDGIWIPGWSTQGLKRGYWSKDAVVFPGDGTVDLQTRKGTGKDEGYDAAKTAGKGWQINNRNFTSTGNTEWIAGALHRREIQTQGYFEAKIKMNKASKYHWDAFWAYEQSKGADAGEGELVNATKILYEYDMMEYVDVGNDFDQTTHWWNKDGGRVIYPSKTQKSAVSGKTDLSDWFVLGLYWDKDVVIYYVDGEETIRLNANGTGSSTGSHGSLDSDDMKSLAAVKEGMNVDDNTLAVSQFAGMNFKLTTELGWNYGGSDVEEFEAGLEEDLGDDGYDSFIVEYYAEYDIK